MIAWMLYAILVGACVVVAATAADWLFRVRRLPVRFVWIGAAALCIALAATATVRAPSVQRDAAAQPIDLSSLSLMQTSMRSVERHVPASAAFYAAALWALATLLVLVWFVVVQARLRRARQEWRAMELHGQRVRVSSSAGPFVIGVLRPEIVIPQWVLGRAPHEQRVILAHEEAHVRAGDHIALFAACALVGLMPWNPAVWIILSRLRLAIELDCDARVLRRGISPRVYGTLLVDVAERALPLRFSAVALSDGSSHLHQRIVAMETRRITHPIMRGAGVALVGLAGLLAACEATMPTSADVERMDAASAERSARDVGVAATDTFTVWTVDGKETSEAAAKAIPRDSIARISLSGVAPDRTLRMYIVTKKGEPSGVAYMRRSTAGSITADGKVDVAATLKDAIETKHPLLIVDGKRVDYSALKALNPSNIAGVEVVKGPAALEEYGADASRGVIVVRTKP